MRNTIFSKIFGEVKTFPETLQPIMLLSRLLGLSVIEYPIGHPWFKLSIITSLIRCTVYGYLLYYSECIIVRKSTAKINISYTVYYIVRFINIALVAIMIVFNFISYRAKTLYVKKMIMIDATLKEFGINPEYSNELRRNACISLIWCILSVIIHVSDFLVAVNIYNYLIEAFIKTIVSSIPITINILSQLKFGEQISIIARRFEQLNALTHKIVESTRGMEITKNVNKYHRILRRNQPRNASEDSTNKYKDNIVIMLKTIRQIHLFLCTFARETMEVFGTEILLQLSSIFILFTSFTYITYLLCEAKFTSTAVILHCCYLWLIIIIKLSAMIFIMNSTTSVMEEAKQASRVAFEIQSSDQEVLNEIHQLSLQVMQHPLYLTASGFFVMDFVYVRGFIGSIATYFMILIQNQPDN